MRRAGRWLLNGVTVLLAVLALAAAVETVRGFWMSDALQWSSWRAKTGYALGMTRGGLMVGSVYDANGVMSFTSGYRSRPATPYYAEVDDLLSQSGAKGFQFAGFAYVHAKLSILMSTSWEVRMAVIPLPFLALLFALLPALRLRSHLRRRRLSRVGLCAGCGYDLRATPGRCPECGRVAGVVA